MKNYASYCWRIVPVAVKQSFQWLLKNYASDCWIIVPVTVEQSCHWLLNNRASDCWIIAPETVEELCQWLLMNDGNGCQAVVPVVFFSLFNFTLAKSLPVFRVNNLIIIIDYFTSGSQLSKLQVYWLIIIFIFSLYMFY